MAETVDVLTVSSPRREGARPMKAVRFAALLRLSGAGAHRALCRGALVRRPGDRQPDQLCDDISLQVLPLFIAAIGDMMVLLVAQIDLSATSIMAMGCVVGASIMTSRTVIWRGTPWLPLVAVLAIIAIGRLWAS